MGTNKNRKPREMPLATSPFSQTDMQPLGEYEQRGSHLGLRFPDGAITVNFTTKTSYAMMSQLAKFAGAEIIVIKGTWKFTPDIMPESEGE